MAFFFSFCLPSRKAGGLQIPVFDGVPVDESNDGYRQYSIGTEEGSMEMGHGAASSRFWLGYIDEFQIFSHILSSEQILQSYISVLIGDTDKSVLISDENSSRRCLGMYSNPPK